MTKAQSKEIAPADIDQIDQAKPYRVGVDLDKLIELYSIKGNTQEQCAKILGCSRSTVKYHVKHNGIKQAQDDKQFESIQAVKLQSKVGMLTDALTPDKAQKARVTELTTGIGTLLDKLAAIQGKAGMVIHVITAQERQAEIDVLDAAYKELEEA